MGHVEQFADYLHACYAPAPVITVRVDGTAACLEGCLDPAAAAVVAGPASLDQTLARHGLRPSFRGWSRVGERLAILQQPEIMQPRNAPPWFRVMAIVPVFNEADVIEGTLRYLIDDGIRPYVIDNWSTDSTLSIVRQFEGRGLEGFERFPPRRAPQAYDLRAILGRVEELAIQLDADWFILHDADERRRSPWTSVGMRDALYHVDQRGFTCVDHVTLNFWPTDDRYDSRLDLEAHFQHFEFSAHPGHFHQRRAWKNLGQGVSLAPSAGHDATFYGRRVYPFKFLLKHYPVRSQSHGVRKIVQERRARWNAAERSLGWHQQYDGLEEFTRAASDLNHFDPQTFYEQYLIERLSGIGVFDAPPDWATPPLWNPALAA